MTTIRNAFRKILNTMDMPAPFVEPSLKERLKILRVPRIIAAHEVHLRSILVNDGLLQQSQKAKAKSSTIMALYRALLNTAGPIPMIEGEVISLVAYGTRA